MAKKVLIARLYFYFIYLFLVLIRITYPSSLTPHPLITHPSSLTPHYSPSSLSCHLSPLITCLFLSNRSVYLPLYICKFLVFEKIFYNICENFMKLNWRCGVFWRYGVFWRCGGSLVAHQTSEPEVAGSNSTSIPLILLHCGIIF